MRMKFFLIAGTVTILSGCMDQASSPTASSAAEGELSSPSGELSYGLREMQNSTYFQMHVERQSNAGSGVERFVDCSENGLLTGFGGRVNGDGNFTHITAYCRDITSNGTLGAEYSRAPWGISEESVVKADPGYVAVGIAGAVDGNNLVNAAIRQCKWDGSTFRVIPATCEMKHSNKTTEKVELYYSIHEHVMYSAPYFPEAALQGVGLTAGSEALKAIRFTGVLLK